MTSTVVRRAAGSVKIADAGVSRCGTASTWPCTGIWAGMAWAGMAWAGMAWAGMGCCGSTGTINSWLLAAATLGSGIGALAAGGMGAALGAGAAPGAIPGPK